MDTLFKGKILAMAALAALIGMDGLFSLIDQRIRGMDAEPAVQVQAGPADKIVMLVPRIEPQSICIQNDIPDGGEPALLDEEEAAPLMDQEIESIEWNGSQDEILRNARNITPDLNIVLASVASMTDVRMAKTYSFFMQPA
ncbi:MAG: hypothetical protein ABL951_10835 [Alphaproteobacteria bacterium]